MPRPLRLFAALAPFLATSAAFGQGFSPQEAVKRMQLPPGFTARLVASEPMIRQPVSMSFDHKGRLWVLQYLQYPNPAGLKAVKQDEYLRTVWDRVPEPPPKGPKGADRLTILEDPDEHGVYRKSKDFVAGLNLASGFCIGHGGVFVVQPPYLLFYPDKDCDDVPDGDPEVRLTGFGMEDSHSYANSLQWGPDGWLYGAHGSTVTAKIVNPVKPHEPPIEFQQGVWRYHPLTHQFELFAEGGGNTWGLDFDKHGQLIAGTNWGGFACLHMMQGAYYVKGWAKHGPLHNPHAYGYFDHIPYTGFKGGHVTCGGIIYQGDTYPSEYRDQYIAGNLLSNAVYWHKLEPNGSTFKASHGGDFVVANDTWFRPVDLMLGPDGSVYVADWTDKRAAHLDPIDNWDRTNGRIYKIEYQGTPAFPTFDLSKKSSLELVELLKHPNAWWRREARRLLAERRDPTVIEPLTRALEFKAGIADPKGYDEVPDLERLWALHVSGGLTERLVAEYASLWGPQTAAWAVRLLGDRGVVETEETRSALAALAGSSHPVVRAQAACTARRLPAAEATRLLESVLYASNDMQITDPFIPLLLWWGIESKFQHLWLYSNPLAGHPLEGDGYSNIPVSRFIAERTMRRALADVDPAVRREVLIRTTFAHEVDGKWSSNAPVLRALELSLDEKRPLELAIVRDEFVRNRYIGRLPADDLLLRVATKVGVPEAIARVTHRATDMQSPETERAKWVSLAVQVGGLDVKRCLELLTTATSDRLRLELVRQIGGATSPDAATGLLARYPSASPAVKRDILSTLLSRPTWTQLLLSEVDAGRFPKAELTADQLRIAAGKDEPETAKLIAKHWGRIGGPTPGEKQARISWLSTVLGRDGLGDRTKGHALFTQQCAACHQLFGEGGKVGPDLTTADRKDRRQLLMHVIDPSAYIRPEYVSHRVDLADGRSLVGLLAETPGGGLTVTTAVGGKPETTALSKADVEKTTPSPVSLMPEKLLDTLTDEQVRDLFAYVCSEAPAGKTTGVNPAARQGGKLRVLLVSGSLEYKSDESLAGFQKYLEATYPVECVRAFRKTDDDLPGLDQLDTCDVAVFFTRRLTVDGEQLERIKKYVAAGKPVVGIRTASHGFQKWLAMDKLVFGGDYKNHHKVGPVCRVTVADAAKAHPVLRGVTVFESASSLYKNPQLTPDVTVLLTGDIPGGSDPVAWVRQRPVDGKVQRVFYTSLGGPEDFKNPIFLRLLTNGLFWAAGKDVPAGR
ncbi:MAG: PVC-type heme-binding CxxCH protein [Gemmataceae bacterium]